MGNTKMRPSTILIAFIALTSVTAQTFQYSRGWVNGKRDGQRRSAVDMREIANSLDKTLNPCQINKLKFILQGKPFNEKVFMPCDYMDYDDNQPKRSVKMEKNQDQFLEAFL